MAISHATTVRNTLATAVWTAIDADASAGKIKFYTTSFTTLVATVTLADPSFQSPAANGSISTVSGSLSGTCVADGTLAVFRITDGADTTVLEGTVGLSGADINLTSVAFNTGDTIVITSLTYTASP